MMKCALLIGVALAGVTCLVVSPGRAQAPAAAPAARASAEPAINRYLPALEAAEARGDWPEVERLARAAVEALRARLGENDTNVAEALEWLGVAVQSQGRHPEAETYYRRALQIRRATQGEQNPETAEAYQNVAASLDNRGRYAEAEPLFRKALEIYRTVLGERHPDTAEAYNYLAFNLYNQGRYAEAEPLLREAVEIFLAALGEQHPKIARGYSNLASSLSRQGRYAEAEPLHRKALEISRAAFGDQHPVTANSYANLAVSLDDQGRHSEAEPVYLKALEIRRRFLGEQHPYTAISYDRLASNLDRQGRHAEAEPLHRKGLEIRLNTLGVLHPDTADSYNKLALNLEYQGRTAEADQLYIKALEIRRTTLGEQHPATAASYNNIAGSLERRGRYVEAEPLLRKAVEIYRTVLGERHLETAIVYNNLALNLDNQGRYAEAEPLLRKALEINRTVYGERHPVTANSYANLAAILASRGRHSEAEPLLRKALDIYRAALGDHHPVTANSYANLAVSLDDQGRYAEAEPLHRKGLEIRRAALGDQHPDTAESYDGLATNLDRRSRYTEAEEAAGRAVAVWRTNRAGTPAINAVGDDDPRGGPLLRYTAIAWNAAAERPERLASLRASAYTALQDGLSGTTARALAQAAARARAASEQAPAAGCSSLDLPGLIREQQDLQGRARFEDARLLKALGAADQSDAPRARAALEAITAQLGVLDAEISRCFPRYAELVSTDALDLAGTQARLQENEAVLLIAPAEDDVIIFAVSKTDIAWHRLEKGAAPLADRVGRLRCQLDPATCEAAASAATRGWQSTDGDALTRGDAGFDRAASYGLYRDLVQPVEAALGGATRLYVVTSGPIGSLPLGVLATSAPLAGEDDADPAVLASTAWLSDRYAMTTLPSVSALRVFGHNDAARTEQSFLGFGDPELGERATVAAAQAPTSEAVPADDVPSAPVRVYRSVDANGVSLADPQTLRRAFAPLPGTRAELRNIALALGAPASSLRLGAEATETAVRSSRDLATAQVVVFATHGLLPREIAGLEEPGLVFTPPATATAQDDGVLAASEAATLSLSARWVILSACNTASADGSSSGESLSGLAKAFLYAGAQALLASHWRVRDDASALITVETLAVQRANPRMTRAQALQQAMRTVRTGKRPDGTVLPGWNPAMAHPSAWAPFTIVSDQDR